MNRFGTEPDDDYDLNLVLNDGYGPLADFLLPLLMLFLVVIVVRRRSGANLSDCLKASPGLSLLGLPILALLILYLHDFGVRTTILIAGNAAVYAGVIAILFAVISYKTAVARIIKFPATQHICIFAFLLSSIVAAHNTSWLGTSNTGAFRMRLWDLSTSERDYQNRLNAIFPSRKMVGAP